MTVAYADTQTDPGRVLDFLLRQKGCPLSATELAKRLDVGRQTVHNKRTGTTKLYADEIADYALALEVPPELFLMTPEAAAAWLSENKSAYFRCNP